MTGSAARPNPCPSCPYRRDAPSGVWAAEEYEKLPDYDGEIIEQIGHPRAARPFYCHSTPDRVCTGWLCHRDPGDLLAVRLGVSSGQLDPSVVDHTTAVPLWPSGRAAADHGTRDVEAPGDDAREAIRKITRARPDIRGATSG